MDDALYTLGLGNTNRHELTEGDIRRAFKERSKATHPDLGGSNAAHSELVRAHDFALSCLRHKNSHDVESPLMKARKEAARRMRAAQAVESEDDANAVLNAIRAQRARQQNSQRSSKFTAHTPPRSDSKSRRGFLLFVAAAGAFITGALQRRAAPSNKPAPQQQQQQQQQENGGLSEE